ncbi:hypothetical protein D3C81_1376200 [compost metagenome]
MRDAAEQVFGVVAQRQSGRGQHHAARLALEQGHAQFGLERLELLRQRRLLDAKLLGRTGHRALLGHGKEIAQVPEFHVGI